jgi:hypothetical protein
MTLFTIAKEFCLDQRFDESKQPDVRLRIHELYQRTKETVARERQISLEVGKQFSRNRCCRTR